MKTLKERLSVWEKQFLDLKTRLNQNYASYIEEVIQKLLQTVGVEVKNKVNNKFEKISLDIVIFNRFGFCL